MQNRVAHILTNDKGPFEDLGIAENRDFIPRRLTTAQIQLRELLFLGVNDHYLGALLAALYAWPDIAGNVEDVTTHDPSRVRPGGVTMEGGKFLVSKQTRGKFLDNDISLPLNFTYTIEYFSASQVTIKAVERGQEVRAQFKASSKVMHISWPAGIPFEGPIELQQTWEAGAMIVIKVRPSKFPYAEFVRRVVGNNYLNHRMLEIQLMEEYFASEDPVEKAAMIALAILTDDPEILGLPGFGLIESTPTLPDEDFLPPAPGEDFCPSADSTKVSVDSTEWTVDNICELCPSADVTVISVDSTIYTVDDTCDTGEILVFPPAEDPPEEPVMEAFIEVVDLNPIAEISDT